MARDCGGAECNAAASITCARKEIAILPGAVKHWVKTNIKHEPAAHERGLAPDRASDPRLLPAVTAPELTALPIGEIAVEGIESGLDTRRISSVRPPTGARWMVSGSTTTSESTLMIHSVEAYSAPKLRATASPCP